MIIYDEYEKEKKPGSFVMICGECGTNHVYVEWLEKKYKDSNVDNALLADVRADLLKKLLTGFMDLLSESKYYYNLYPNNHRITIEEYFKIEDELIKKVSEHFR